MFSLFLFAYLQTAHFSGHHHFIFENHAGCEKSYFRKSLGEVVPLEKYSDRDTYKLGNRYPAKQ